MSKEELIRECKVDGLLKPALESNLKEVLRGIQRVPALCFPQQQCSLQELSLGNYEVLPVEPLHDLKEHINNIFKELPIHLNDEEKVLFDETMEAVLSTKEKLQGSDYVLTLHLGKHCRLRAAVCKYRELAVKWKFQNSSYSVRKNPLVKRFRKSQSKFLKSFLFRENRQKVKSCPTPYSRRSKTFELDHFQSPLEERRFEETSSSLAGK